MIKFLVSPLSNQGDENVFIYSSFIGKKLISSNLMLIRIGCAQILARQLDLVFCQRRLAEGDTQGESIKFRELVKCIAYC